MTKLEKCMDHVLRYLESDTAKQPYFGENVSQLEHALQAAYLAQLSQSKHKASSSSSQNDKQNTHPSFHHPHDSENDNEKWECMVIASLFHDIGHLIGAEDTCSKYETMSQYGTKNHEDIGAQLLKECGFSEKVCELVRGHVQAKRYLTFKNPQYLQKLSDASLQTLNYQGGPMDEEEAKQFDMDPLKDWKLEMRSFDEGAKVVGWNVPLLQTYRPIILRHLQKQQNH